MEGLPDSPDSSSQGRPLKDSDDSLLSDISRLEERRDTLMERVNELDAVLASLAEEKGLLNREVLHPSSKLRDSFVQLLLHKHVSLLHRCHFGSQAPKSKRDECNIGALSRNFSLRKSTSSAATGFSQVTPFKKHSSIAVTGFGRGGTTALGSIIANLHGYRYHKSQDVNFEDDLFYSLSSKSHDRLEELVHLIMDRDAEGPQWSIKLPHLTHFLMGNADFAAAFSNRNIIIIFRDFAACAIAESNRPGYEGCPDYAKHYGRIFSSITWCIEHASQYAWGIGIVSYEKLLSRPHPTISDMLTWINSGDQPDDAVVAQIAGLLSPEKLQKYSHHFEFLPPS